jgi:hypothetical protein
MNPCSEWLTALRRLANAVLGNEKIILRGGKGAWEGMLGIDEVRANSRFAKVLGTEAALFERQLHTIGRQRRIPLPNYYSPAAALSWFPPPTP